MAVRGVLGLLLAQLCLTSGFKIEAMEHDIQDLTAKNFDTVIGKFRDSAVAALWFYKPGEKADKDFLEAYNAVAKELKGMIKVTSMSCDDWPVFCKQHDVVTTPMVKVFPVNPQPAYVYSGELSTKKLSNHLSKLIQSKVTVLTKENVDTFLATDVTKPRVLLFSNKDKVPTILKALSSDSVFIRSINFGFVTEKETEIVNKYKVKKFPQILMLRGAKAEQKEMYKGGMTFAEIFEWVNLYSESGMGDKVKGGGGAEESAEEAKPWLIQDIPEFTGPSHQDICIKPDGLCVIYLTDGPITDKETSMLTSLKGKYTSQLSDRGTILKWMYMNLALEPEYKTLFAPDVTPGVVIFNPHKRLRFTKLEEKTATSENIAGLVDKLMGGDARFTMVKGQKLPKFATRSGDKKEL